MKATVTAVKFDGTRLPWDLTHTSWDAMIEFIEAVRYNEEDVFQVSVLIEWPKRPCDATG